MDMSDNLALVMAQASNPARHAGTRRIGPGLSGRSARRHCSVPDGRRTDPWTSTAGTSAAIRAIPVADRCNILAFLIAGPSAAGCVAKHLGMDAEEILGVLGALKDAGILGLTAGGEYCIEPEPGRLALRFSADRISPECFLTGIMGGAAGYCPSPLEI